MNSRLLNVGLRAATLLSKFILIVFLAKYLKPADLGLIGLVMVTIAYLLFVLGCEFYTYTTREMLGSDRQRWMVQIRNHAVVFGFTYPAMFFVIPLIFYYELLPWEILPWFALLLVLEHISQELYRILIPMAEQTYASIVMFLRSGLWGVFVIGYMWRVPESRNIETVFLAWSIGAALGSLLGLWRLRMLDRSSFSEKIDWLWIFRGVKVAVPLLIASLAIRGLFTFDRYYIEWVADLSVLGAYVLFAGIANAIIAIVDSGVMVFLYPKVVSDARKGDWESYRKNMKRMLLEVVGLTTLLIVCAQLLLGLMLEWLGKDEYLANAYLFNWLLLAVSLYLLGMVPHMGLYAQDKDRVIFFSQFAGLIVFLLTAYVGGAVYGAVAVPWALVIAFFLILIWKSLCYLPIHVKLVSQ